MTTIELREKHFPKIKFRNSDLRQAGKLLKNSGEDAAVVYLSEQHKSPPKGNFCPPAKCEIVGFSRPLSEWPIARVSANIQRYIYDLSREDRAKEGTFRLNKDEYKAWFQRTGVDNAGYTCVQGLDKMFKNALHTYDGVVTKVENRNKKLKKRAEKEVEKAENEGREVKKFEPENAFNEEGFLKEKPGVNPSIWTYQQISPEPYNPNKHPQVKLSPGYAQSEPKLYTDRLAIPEGDPGHVPQWQRDEGLLSENTHKRMRAQYSHHNSKVKPNRKTVRDKDECFALGAHGALVAVIAIGEDWVAFDLRGLLRSVYWRNVIQTKQMTTMTDLLKLFTGDPTIDPLRNEITFIYKEDVIPIFSLEPLREKKGRDQLLKLTAPKNGVFDFIAVASVDLGVINPAAMSYSRLRQDAAGKFEIDELAREFLPPPVLDQLGCYRQQWDRMEGRFKEQALATLTEAVQAEYREVYGRKGDDYAKFLVEKLQLTGVYLPWDQMSSWTTYITDALLERKDSPANYHQFVVQDKGKKKGKKKEGQEGAKSELKLKEKPSDWDWAYRYCRKQLSEETRKLFNEALWQVKRTSPEYARLSKQKKDLARQVANHIVRQARKFAVTQTLVVIVENINVVFFHGTGKRTAGWDQCFVHKKENRWFVQAIHKALTEIAMHKGIWVIEAAPYYTSLHCPKCEHIDSDNRCGEEFRCLKCGYVGHADRDVATYNIRFVALRGESLKKPKKIATAEQQGDATPEYVSAVAEKPRKNAMCKKRKRASGEVAIVEAEALA